LRVLPGGAESHRVTEPQRFGASRAESGERWRMRRAAARTARAMKAEKETREARAMKGKKETRAARTTNAAASPATVRCRRCGTPLRRLRRRTLRSR
jgi:rubrerythrin